MHPAIRKGMRMEKRGTLPTSSQTHARAAVHAFVGGAGAGPRYMKAGGIVVAVPLG